MNSKKPCRDAKKFRLRHQRHKGIGEKGFGVYKVFGRCEKNQLGV
jgi:hypothetical protein